MGPLEVVSPYSETSTWTIAHPSRSSIGAFIMSLTYGFEVKSHDDPFLAAAERGVTLTEEATVPGGYLVNTLPICTHQA